MLKSITPSTLTAGFITVLVAYSSSTAIVFEAAKAAGATPAQLASWLTVLGLALGVTSIGFSLRYRLPILTAWCTPGAALLATGLLGHDMADATGIFMFSGGLVVLCGITGWFERLMQYIPTSIAAAMLAGVLLHFGMEVFSAMSTQLYLVFPMLLSYLLLRRVAPRWAILGVLLVGLSIAALAGLIRFDRLHLAVARPVWVSPVFHWQSLLSIGLPLFAVTMASQNVPGIAILRSFGYTPPVSPLLSWTGLVTVLLAPFGCFAINMAAISAAICAGDEAHPDPSQRYLASVMAGALYLTLGVLGASVGVLLTALPQSLVLAIGGIALFGALSNGLASAMQHEAHREAALLTFLVTASGMHLGGIGSAFWGLVAGGLAWVVANVRQVRPA